MRLLADVDALLLDVLIPACGLPDGQVGELLVDNVADVLPFVRSHRWGGAAVHPEFLDSALCDVDVWADTRTAALDLAESCRVALYRAWQNQTIYTHGSIASYDEQSAPAELRTADQLDGVTQVHATYRLGVCPPL